MNLSLGLGLLFLLTFSQAYYLRSHHWDYLIFTQIWPGTKCLHIDAAKKNHSVKSNQHKCVIPESVHGWTIHGLWPNKEGTLGPAFCNRSWHFSDDPIQSLIPEMKKEWPNYYTDQSFDSFWKHEWEKHGTCASYLPALYGEKKYFQKGLDLYGQVDIFNTLRKAGISPDNDKTVQAADVENAIRKMIGDKTPNLICFKKDGNTYIFEIEVCYDKSFNIIDCERDSSSCHGDINYPALHQG